MSSWAEANQRYLTAALAMVRADLERRAGAGAPERGPAGEGSFRAGDALEEAARALPAPAALDVLCATFGLSPFERSVLLLCAGVELDSTFPALCAAAQGDPQRAYPTFSLALAALPEPHWSALTPAAPLRYWRLVELSAGGALTGAPLRIDERILHYLAGVSQLDDRLVGLVEPLRFAEELAPSQRVVAEKMAQVWTRAAHEPVLPIVQLCGSESVGKRAIAAAACAAVGLDLHLLSAHLVPLDPREQEALIRLWEREAALGAGALLLDCDEVDGADVARATAISRLIERTRGAVVVASREPRRNLTRAAATLDVRKPTASEQKALWQTALGREAARLNGSVENLVAQFDLSAPAIRAAAAEALGTGAEDGPQGEVLGLARAVWESCRAHSRPRLDDLAQRLEPVATWRELVLPALQLETLHEIAAHVRRRHKVYETWGFAARSARGLGISALFAGASGTGKTMAAEVLANELRLDLYRIDLSSVVSKYIGETEKNLRRVFDAAEEGGAILLFDEADALFGKRSEIKDSHDRYANIEVSYLLQRMEAYRGLAILTTNMKEALDTAFLRRLRFIVNFPFPDAAQRAEIWRRIFPDDTPTQGLDIQRLARLSVAGGNIRNIALNAAFLAADAGVPVGMTHLLRAARGEYAKLSKSLTETEVGGWT